MPKKTPPTPPIPPTPLEEGKVRTSLFLTRSLLTGAKGRAVEMGMSFNAFVAMAIYNQLNPANPVGPGTGSVLPFSSNTPSSSPSAPSSDNPDLKRFGPGYAYSEEGDNWFATWDEIEAYNAAMGETPDEDWRTIGPRLRLTPGAARAADLAIQMPEFEAYMTAKYGPPSPEPLRTKKKKPAKLSARDIKRRRNQG